MEEEGERCCSDSDDGSAASWVILDEDGPADLVDAPTHVDDGIGRGAPTERAEGQGTSLQQRPEREDRADESSMTGSDESSRTVAEKDVFDDRTSFTVGIPLEEEGSDVEVVPTDPLPSISSISDEYFEDDPMTLPSDGSDTEVTPSSVSGSLPSETVLRRRRSGCPPVNTNTETSDHQPSSGDDEEELEREDEGEQKEELSTRAKRCERDGDKWDESDLSTLPDQSLPDSWAASGAERHYVHRRNNAVNQLLTVLMVLCLTCVLGLGTGHFLGWLHHHEMTEEIVQSLDDRLDDLRGDLMTCMTTEDDQDLDNKWIKELLHENEALLHQLQGDEPSFTDSTACSESFTVMRDQLNQLRTENDELKASVARLRYGSVSQDGHKLREHQNQINQLVTENGELERELRRQRYMPKLNGAEHPTPGTAAPPPSASVGSEEAAEGYSSADMTVTEWMENEAPPPPSGESDEESKPSASSSGHQWSSGGVGSDAGSAAETAHEDTLSTNDTDLSLAAYYARRSSQRHHSRYHPGSIVNWQLGRGLSRAQRRVAVHRASWMFERAQARQSRRQRRGDDADLPHGRQQQQQQQQRGRDKQEREKMRDGERRRGDWTAFDADDDDRDDDDDDDDDDGYSMRVAKTIRKAVRYQQKVWKAANRKAEKLYKKMRENHWKHFGGRNRPHESHQRFYKY